MKARGFSTRLLRGEGSRKGTTGGSEGAGEAISFSTQLGIATWNCCALSNHNEPMQGPGIRKESLFGDVPDLDIYTAINLAMNRAERKANRPYTHC